MFRSRDYILMEVVDIEGKRIGTVKDLIINFSKNRVDGVIVSSYKLFQKSVNVFCKDIIASNGKMIAGKVNSEDVIGLNSVKNMDIVDAGGNIIGIIEDIIFDPLSFKIKGIIISTGIIKNLIYGKKVVLTKELILGENNILFFGDANKISLRSIPHKLFMRADCHEKIL